jgi:hypothetical protein
MTTTSGKRSVSVEHTVAFGLLTTLGLFALVLALGYGLFKEGARVGPGLVPAVVGAGTALIAGWELVATLRGRRASHDHGIAEVAASVSPASVGPVSPVEAAGEAVAPPVPPPPLSEGNIPPPPLSEANIPPPPLSEATAGGGAATPSAGPADGIDIFGRTASMRTRQLAVVFTALVVTVLLVPVLGFLVAFFVLSVFISAVVERRPWLPSAVISLLAVLAVYAVFGLFLNVPLPEGLLGIGG